MANTLRAHGQPGGKDRESMLFFRVESYLGVAKQMFEVSELNFRDAMCCLRGSDQALQSDAMGISSVSKHKRDEVSSLRVDMGNPSYYSFVVL